MNTGIIATRYATALLELVDETGTGRLVLSQIETICGTLSIIPEFQRDIDNPSIPSARKLGLFDASLDGKMAPELRRFVELLIRNGRIGYARRIFTTFINEYYRSRHIRRATLVVADPALLDPESNFSDPGPVEGPLRQARRPVGESVEPQRPTLESRLRALVEKETGDRLILKTKVDPSLLGGFVFEVEDTVLDASVVRQIDVIRHQLKEMNRRIV